MAKSRSVKFEVRVCPGCGEEKEFPKRNETCSNECRWRVQNSPLQREVLSLRKSLRDSEDNRRKDEKYERFVGRISAESTNLVAPNWTMPRSGSAKNVIPTAFLSDTHFDEVIDPAQINGMNAYGREIAELRLKRFFESAVKVGKQYLTGLDFPGICMPLGGDLFSGNIHEELAETNEAKMCDSVLYWLSPMISGIRLLANEYGKVYIPSVVGNHPRGTRKPINKGRVRDNFDWLFSQLLARELSGDKRVQFAISESPDLYYSLFGTRYCLTHGDQFKGGGGIAGLMSPLMLGNHRKLKTATAVNRPYDYLLMGHFHQLMSARGVIVNGSLKGYDEYGFNNNFDYEPPQQAFWLTSQERKEIWAFSPLHVTNKTDPYSGHRTAAATSGFSLN